MLLVSRQLSRQQSTWQRITWQSLNDRPGSLGCFMFGTKGQNICFNYGQLFRLSHEQRIIRKQSCSRLEAYFSHPYSLGWSVRTCVKCHIPRGPKLSLWNLRISKLDPFFFLENAYQGIAWRDTVDKVQATALYFAF